MHLSRPFAASFRLLAVLALVGAGGLTYPATPRVAVVDTYFGTPVPDPYRWLERVHAPATRRWVAAQTSLTERELGHRPRRAAIRALVLRLMSAPSDGLPQWGGTTTAFSRSDGSLKHPWIVVSRAGRESVLLDPNLRWRDGTTSLADWQLAPDGRSLAYATKRGGGGFVTWHVLDVSSRTDRRDVVAGVPDWAPIAWAHDGSGFYYGGYASKLPPPSGAPIGTGYRACFHRVGTVQSADRVVYARADHPTWLTYAGESADGHFLIDGAVDGDGSGGTLVAVRDLRVAHAPVRLLRPLGAARYDYVDDAGNSLYFFTNADAPHGKLVAIDLRDPRSERDVIPEARATLVDVTAVGGRFVARYLRDVRSELIAFTRSGTPLRAIALPGPGSVEGIDGDTRRPVAYYRFSSPTTPPTTFAFDARTDVSRRVARSAAPFDVSAYVTAELFARSADGARIPVFVAYRRDRARDASTPALLTGYGGFGDPYLPTWSTLGAAWLGTGGTFAIANIRGGGEYGEAWHRAGMLGNKQHVFDDFAAAAKMLESRGFASRSTLGIYGYSGGGLLTGVCEVEHPELYGAVVEAAGPVDVLRGHTYGSESAWVSEVGSPLANAAQFQWLYRYAPLVHARRGVRYPATLVMTSADDERVSPAHAYKFAATLQYAQRDDTPILLYVARGTGHIGGGTLAEQAAPLAAAETFLWSKLSLH